ncbi:hypothetical protein NL676_008593 [Syzygium grande]|nr:hypothetical protein NL676_008593 [Syzygium grande]
MATRLACAAPADGCHANSIGCAGVRSRAVQPRLGPAMRYAFLTAPLHRFKFVGVVLPPRLAGATAGAAIPPRLTTTSPAPLSPPSLRLATPPPRLAPFAGTAAAVTVLVRRRRCPAAIAACSTRFEA